MPLYIQIDGKCINAAEWIAELTAPLRVKRPGLLLTSSSGVD